MPDEFINYILEMIKLLLVGCLMVLAHTQCNSTHPFKIHPNPQCYIQCPWTPPNFYYAYSTNYTCQTTCPSSTYGFIGNRSCITVCPASPNITYYDDINRKCVSQCPDGTFAAANRSCLANCPSGSWGDMSMRVCVTTCEVGTFYSVVPKRLCMTVCPANYYAYPPDRTCYIGGTCPNITHFSDDTTGLCVTLCPGGYFADPNLKRCVRYCNTSNLFAQSQSRTCVTTCPTDHYRSSVVRACVKQCTQGQFKDLLSGNCTRQCSSNHFGDSTTGTCRTVCPQPYFADPAVMLCVLVCSNNLYADNNTQRCVTAANCFSNTIGNPTNRRCIQPTTCPTSPYMFADLTNKICTTRCSTWGNTVTRTCVSQCPWNPSTYVTWANLDTRQCVTQCPQFPIRYAQNISRTCVDTCPFQNATVPYNTYADPISQQCVRDCPDGYVGDQTHRLCVRTCSIHPTLQFYNAITGKCVTACPVGFFSDINTLMCVTTCSLSPYYFQYDNNNTCLSVCPNGFFGDNSTQKCVEYCPTTTQTYADSSVNLCVRRCPLFPDTYGQISLDGNRRCVSQCIFGTYADPLTRTCVLLCNISLGYYGERSSKKCVLQCPSNQFADNSTATCVSQCPNFPITTFGDPNTKTCQHRCPNTLFANRNNNKCGTPSQCPTDHFADNYTRMCVSICPLTYKTFGQPTSRTCVQVCPEGLWADSTTRLCSSSCSSTWNLYRDNSTKSCVQSCPSKPNLYADPNTMRCQPFCTNNFFAYDPLRVCVAICPDTPPYYGDYNTMRCVQGCPRQSYMFINNTFRGCVKTCPPRVYSAGFQVDTYADNSTWSCVNLCPQSQFLYNFKHPTNASIRHCVSTCPMLNTTGTFYFAQNITQSCVLTCPYATQLTYGDIFVNKCVRNCSRNQFRDNTTARCVYGCSNGFYADNSTWNCVSRCPPGTFAESTNRTCNFYCPKGTYADNRTRFCRSLCDLQQFMFSDNTSWSCVSRCPSFPDLFADPNTKYCTNRCTGGLYANNWTRSCLPAINCTNGTIADPLSGRCVAICPIRVPSFLQSNNTNICATSCPAGTYADNSTMRCVQQCPSSPDFFAFNHSTLNGICVLFCPMVSTWYYRHIPTRHCVAACPEPYFRDTCSMRCVLQCPQYYYAQIVGRICMDNCSANNRFGYKGKCVQRCPNHTLADPTTALCVQACPFGYFAQNNTCIVNCSLGYADPFTKICQNVCSPDYYSYRPTRECRQNCYPQYKFFLNQTCQVTCPTTNQTSTNLYMDNTTYSCLNKCLPTWYADNLTRSCTTTCSPTLFADNSTGLCVVKCPQSPDFYGFEKVCHFPCPVRVPALFAQNLTRTCMPICPNNSYADSYNWRCVLNCTGVQFGFTDNVEPICVKMCPSPTYGHRQSKTCVHLCPNGTFGQNRTRRCMSKCPVGQYADVHLRLCVQHCNNSIPEFADPSTHTCVVRCPSIPSLYGQFQGPTSISMCVSACSYSGNYTLNTTRLCVTWCPEPYFADPITKDCTTQCQMNHDLYADNVTRSCIANCPNVTMNGTNGTTYTVLTYADDSTKRCVFVCPFAPSLYGDNSTNKCVHRCGFQTYGDNQTRLCLKTCLFGVPFMGGQKFTYADNSTNFCVYRCPANSYADNITFTCMINCTSGSFADDSTWKCVAMCPSNPISYSKLPQRQCVYKCPIGFFASEVGRTCLRGRCPTIPAFYFRDFQNNQCVLRCVFPYFSEVSSQSCVTNCSYGFYQNLGSKSCSRCPSSCLTCINPQNCTTCIAGLYQHKGQCLTDCPSFPVYYYKYDPSFTCLTACPSPFFGFAGTGKCQNTCPGGYFSNTTSGACQTCPTGCFSCYGQPCNSCFNTHTFVQKYRSCSLKCNASHIYYLNGNCSNSCPAGTFLLDDLVTCQKCNPSCAECSFKATNCTKCQGTFWYNYNCVTQCPLNFFVDRNKACRECSSNPSACALPPLSFTITVQTIGYQLFVDVTFNRPVVMSIPQFRKTARLRTNKGPLQASQYSSFQISPTTYRNKLNQKARYSHSLNQLSFFVSFAPGSIFDSSGNSLNAMTATTAVPVTNAITPQTQLKATGLASQINYVSWILICVLFALMLRANYPMIVLLDLLQFAHMHIYVAAIPLPFLFMKVFEALGNVNFIFLPKLYTNSTPDASLPYFIFQPDSTFLGNFQPLVFFVGLFLAAYLLFWLLSSHRFPIKCIRQGTKKIFRHRMRFSFLHQMLYYPGFFVLFFAFYQFTGANSNISASAGNLALAIAVVIVYSVWIVALTYIASKYKSNMSEVPKKHSFIALQHSNFPLQIPFRVAFKLAIACSLIAQSPSVQLILLMIFNVCMVIFTCMYTPAKYSSTNYINVFIHLCFIGVQIALFIYNISSRQSGQQMTTSYAIFAVVGLAVLVTIAWMIYRLIKYIREECCGVPAQEVQEKSVPLKAKGSDYQKIKTSSQIMSIRDKSQKHMEKQMNVSQLNFGDQIESQANSMNADQLVKQLAYHFVPKKTDELIKQEKALIGEKEEKGPRINQPIVIQIDQDELVQDDRPVMSRASTRRARRPKPSSNNRLRLEIESQGQAEAQQERNQVISEQSQESNYWTRKKLADKQNKPEAPNMVVWDEQDQP